MKEISNSKNSLFLALTRIFTVGVGIISTMILSKMLSLEIVGTYSAANTIISLITYLSVIGLGDAANYFFNKFTDKEKQKKYIDTILGIQLIIGIMIAIIILLNKKNIIFFYNNKMLGSLIIYICIRPYLENTLLVLQVLNMAIGKAKMIAIRNVIISLFKVIIIGITAVYTKDLKTIFCSYIFIDCLIIIIFVFSFSKEKFNLNPFKIDLTLIKEILNFSIPMGIYIITNNLAKDIDKLVIGFYEPTSKLAIYSNCSISLPLDMISVSFFTVIFPLMTKYIIQNKLKKARKLLSLYLKIGYLTTIVFGAILIIFNNEVISFLYGEKYLTGTLVFILYTFVDILKFMNLSLVLTSKGETKKLMLLSFFTFISNFILNILFYKIFGFNGPVIATVTVTVITLYILMEMSSKILETSFISFINLKEVLIFVTEIIVFGFISYKIKNYFSFINSSKIFILILFGGLFFIIIFSLNYSNLKKTFKEIDTMKIQED